MVDWQAIATAAVAALCSIVWWEVRRLRHAKHANAQSIQYALICLALLARHVKFELPDPTKEDD